MKEFLPTYLYIKIHNKTGLKYFGKTTNDPFSYKGSGIHWLRHVKKYGDDITTEILGFYTDIEECRKIATEFSTKNNIVESKEWANMTIENGTDGGDTSQSRIYLPMKEETKKKLSLKKKGKIAWNKGIKGSTPGNKKPKSIETKQKLRTANLGKKRSQESIQKTADKLRGRKRPESIKWLKGRVVSEETKIKIAESNKGKIVSEITKEKIRQARSKQVISENTKKKLKGKVVVVDKCGNYLKISKEEYNSQLGPKQEWEYIFHRCKEAQGRIKNILEIIKNETD